MTSVKGFSVRKDHIMEEFDHLAKNEKLSIGAMDKEIRRFISDSVGAMIENYSDDEFYYGVLEVLSDFVYELSDEETGYRVWTEVDFSKVNEIGSGLKEDVDVLKGIKRFYVL